MELEAQRGSYETLQWSRQESERYKEQRGFERAEQ